MRIGLSATALICLTLLFGCSSPLSNEPGPSFPSDEEQTALYNACMGARGWHPTLRNDGTFDYTFTDEQYEQFATDSSECTDEIGVNEEPDLTQEQWRSFHGKLVEVHDCLKDQGLELSGPPTFQRWMDEGRRWGPYGDVSPEVIGDRLEELETACPPLTTY